jgi:GTPase SAR1 family protein
MNLEKANYEFNKIKFTVDDCLGEHINEPFPNESFFWCCVGKPGSGKTSLMLNALTAKGNNRVYRKVFNKIILVMPENSRKSIYNNPFEDLEQTFTVFNEDVMKTIEDNKKLIDEDNEKRLKDNKPKKIFNQLLIIDDCTAYLKDNPKVLIELATNRRHLKLSIILLVQFLRAVPRPVRFQITNIAFFKPSNELDTKILQEEFCNLKKEEFNELKRLVWKDQHDFLFIDKNKDIYYKNLQKIIFSDNNIDNIDEQENKTSKKETKSEKC